MLVEEENGAPKVTSMASLPLRRKAQAWDEDQVETVEVENRWALLMHSMKHFWSTYSHIQWASKLSSSCDYTLFNDCIQPMWEDSRNKWGGRWLVCLANHQHHSKLDHLWLETLLSLIGESFEEHSREVCGADINICTKGDKISVWTQKVENQTSELHIGRVYKEHRSLSKNPLMVTRPMQTQPPRVPGTSLPDKQCSGKAKWEKRQYVAKIESMSVINPKQKTLPDAMTKALSY
ncbi:PREDICTED: eukaryotic translation initiation factor 4E type 1B-like [Chrysochloris asiatica]|uniref:Eukaryotic translation initiation factor 4E type 1B-like n=1 Tax=Chrysochloris asiatica TaxID=185453 RepID=A0A9B0T2I9_CHRAS|nr:PREDICTED: eukaryotic translation initiation factor 4E type 1B-like [Chrysochloris asiatica]